VTNQAEGCTASKDTIVRACPHRITQGPPTNTYQGMVTNHAERTVLSEVLPWYVLYLNLAICHFVAQRPSD